MLRLFNRSQKVQSDIQGLTTLRATLTSTRSVAASPRGIGEAQRPRFSRAWWCIYGWDEGQGMDGIDSDVDESTGTSYIFFCASGRMLLVGFMGWASLEYALRNWAAVLQLPAPGFFMIRRRTYDLTIKWRRSLMYGLICALAKNEIQNPWMPLRRSFNL